MDRNRYLQRWLEYDSGEALAAEVTCLEGKDKGSRILRMRRVPKGGLTLQRLRSYICAGWRLAPRYNLDLDKYNR